MKPLGENIFLGIVEGFKSQFEEWKKAIQDWWDNHVAPWFTADRWIGIYNNIKDSLKTTWDNTVEQWKTDIQTWWDDDVAKWFEYDTWLELYENIKDALKETWDNTVGQWATDIKDWWDNDVSPWFTFKQWDDLLSSIGDAFQSAFEAAAEMAIEPINSVISAVENMVNGAIDGLNKLIELANKVPGVDLENIGHVDFGEVGFANGGYPAPGLFIAGEAGPELVGTIGGRTAVVNNDQIVQAVSAGVAKAVAGVLGSSSSNQELVVNLDGREVYRSVVSHDRQFKQSTGHSAFNY
jgi:hypothetical protein